MKIIVRECIQSSIKSELTYTKGSSFIAGPLLRITSRVQRNRTRNFAFPTRPFRKKPPGTPVLLLLGRRSESTWAGNKKGQVHFVITTFPAFRSLRMLVPLRKVIHWKKQGSRTRKERRRIKRERILALNFYFGQGGSGASIRSRNWTTRENSYWSFCLWNFWFMI